MTPFFAAMLRVIFWSVSMASMAYRISSTYLVDGVILLQTYVGLYAKYLLFYSDSQQTCFC